MSNQKEAIKDFTSSLTQNFVMKLIEMENVMDVECPKIEVELETEEVKWEVTVKRIKK